MRKFDEIAIEGIGLLTPNARSFRDFKEWIGSDGRSCVAPLVRYPAIAPSIPAAALIPDDRLEECFHLNARPESGHVRRTDPMSEMGIYSTWTCIDSARATGTQVDPAKTGLVSSCESAPAIADQYYRDALSRNLATPSPRLFTSTILNAAACNISIATGLRGPGANLSGGFSAGFSVLENAIRMIHSGLSAGVVACSTDYYTEFCARLLIYGGIRAVPGEGAASLFLSRASGKQGGEYGRITGLFLNYARDRAQGLDLVVKEASSLGPFDRIHSGKMEIADEKALERALGAPGKAAPEITRLSEKLGEYSVIPLLQIIAACAEPEGVRSLVIVTGENGMNAAIAVRSGGKAQ